jgi:hypothetical protein
LLLLLLLPFIQHNAALFSAVLVCAASTCRIPFLLAVLTATAGIVLRWDMPESYEFLNGKTQLQQQQPMAKRQASAGRQTEHADRQSMRAQDAAAADALPSGQQQVADGSLMIGEATTEMLDKQQQHCHVSNGSSSSKRVSWLGHRPISMLFRQHWREVLLMFWFETW